MKHDILQQAHGRRGSIAVASRLSVLPSPEKTAIIQDPIESKPFSSFAIFDDSKRTPVLASQPAPFAIFCDDDPIMPAPQLSSGFAVFEDKQCATPGPSTANPPPATVSEKKPSSFAVFCDEPECQQLSVVSFPAAGLRGNAAVVSHTAAPSAFAFAVFCDED